MNIDLTPVLASATTVQKAWGTEFWLTNTEKYCAKILALAPGWMCSIHSHDLKDETFLVLQGLVDLEVFREPRRQDGETTLWCSSRTLKPGESYRLRPRARHRFSSKYGAIILEVSTRHDDDDVFRLEESRPI